MLFTTTQSYSAPDLADDLVKAFGKAFGLSTAGAELTLQLDEGVVEADVIAVIEAHIAGLPARQLAKAKLQAKQSLDVLAEQVRSKYLTSAPLQAATYINKAADALRYKQAGYPVPLDAAAYPYVDAEMRAAGDTTAQAAADRILGEAATYDSYKGASIEYERRYGKVQIEAAADIAAVTAAEAAASAALKAL